MKKTLYGLKQAPRAWYSRIDAYFKLVGFKKYSYEHTLYCKVEDEKMVIVCLYVDNLIYTKNDLTMLVKFKQSIMEFYMSDLGLMCYFIGIGVYESYCRIFIS